jgi:flagellar hook-basal body complex protein FliE
MSIPPISSPPLPPPGSFAPRPSTGTGNVDFGGTLRTLIASVDSSSSDANAAIGRMLDGTGDVHEAVIAMQKADTELQLTVQIRNKLVQAYQDIMRMPV